MREYVRFLVHDARHFQILTLSSLLGFLFFFNDFGPSALILVLVLGSTCLTQLIFRNTDLRSPFITGLSLCLLFKSNALWLYPLAAAAAIASKFLIRHDNRHIFNPANFAIVAGLIVFPNHVWVSPGQWGSALWLGFGLIACAIVVLGTARRGDIALFFLGSWTALLFGRALWLGDPLEIPLHQLQSGTLLIFAFFMISDPKTTPDNRLGRLVFAVVTACLAYILAFGFQIREALFYALFAVCIMTPVLNTFFQGQHYIWGKS